MSEVSKLPFIIIIITIITYTETGMLSSDSG